MNLKIYLDEIRKLTKVPISEDLIEKDLILSLFLSNWSKLDTQTCLSIKYF